VQDWVHKRKLWEHQETASISQVSHQHQNPHPHNTNINININVSIMTTSLCCTALLMPLIILMLHRILIPLCLLMLYFIMPFFGMLVPQTQRCKTCLRCVASAQALSTAGCGIFQWLLCTKM